MLIPTKTSQKSALLHPPLKFAGNADVNEHILELKVQMDLRSILNCSVPFRNARFSLSAIPISSGGIPAQNWQIADICLVA